MIHQMSNCITLTLCTASAVVISNFICSFSFRKTKTKNMNYSGSLQKKFNSWSVVLFQHTIIYRTHMELFQVHKNWYKKCNCFCHFYSGNWIKSFCPRSSVWSSWSFGGLVKFKHLRTLNTGLTLAQFFVSQPFA